MNVAAAAAAVLLTCSFAHARYDKENEVKNILQRIEQDTLKLRDEIEIAYSKRCTIETLSQCSQSSFNDCSSVFPNQQCMEPDELVFAACAAGGGGTCNALWDKTTSTVSIPSALAKGRNGNPIDPELIETACYTLLAEDHMRTKYENDEVFWDSYNVQPSWTYFGAHNGLFRKFPAVAQEECGNYDPRKRPWFVAASSGPKDVVIVLDVSGSMADFGRLDLAKKAAITVVETLTISDRVAIIAFSDYAYQVHSGTDLLVRATNENKQLLIEQIQALTEGGATNFHAGFQQAFDALERTIQQEYTSGCNVAILFMTDGVNTAGPETNEVLQLIRDGTQRLATEYDRDTKIFTFSLGAQADRSATKEIACSTNGIWTPVDDFDGDLVGAMASYYKLFASGLGNETNFTTWVEPYKFFSDTRRKCAVFYHAARFVRLSTAQCPKINPSGCQLEYLRYLAGGQEATCGICNYADYPDIVPVECPFKPDLPKNLWQNTDMEGVKYSDRACCEIGSNIPSEMCSIPDEMMDTNTMAMGTGGIVGVIIASLFIICCCGWVSYKKCYKPRTNASKTITVVSTPVPVPAPSANALPVASAVPVQVTYHRESSKSISVESFDRGANTNALMSSSASAPPMNPFYHENQGT